MLVYTEETSVVDKKTSSKCKEHTYAQCKESMCRIWTLGGMFPPRLQVSNCNEIICKDSN
jgi:hypothetical protein